MWKFKALLLSVAVLVTGCEIRTNNSTSGIFSRSTTRDTSETVFSISRAQQDSIRQLEITSTVDSTRINTEITTTSSGSSLYEIVTPLGNMTVRLYDQTPSHRDNFIKLANEGYFNGTTFHRVMRNFMIQGGDPNSKDDNPYNDGTGSPGYTTPAEFSSILYHKRGALAAARQRDQVNPQRRSNGSQFYIVQGRPFTSQELDEIQNTIRAQTRNPNFAFSSEARQTYMTIGGAPFLDMQYTVFGEVIDGIDTLDRIASVQTETNDRPIDNITMTVRPVLVQ